MNFFIIFVGLSEKRVNLILCFLVFPTNAFLHVLLPPSPPIPSEIDQIYTVFMTRYHRNELYPSPWNRATYIMLITQVFVCEVVLRANKDSTGTIVSTRNRHQEIGVFF